MKLVAYLRVSTDRQADDGLGLDVQERGIRQFARAHRHRVVAWCRDEGVRGSNGVEEREGLPEALNIVKAGDAAGVIAFNLDRLARKLTVQEAVLGMVWDLGGVVLTVEDGGEVPQDDPDDPMRTAMRQMRGVFAQLDRSMIAKRLRDGKSEKARQGGYAGHGAPPYGTRSVDGMLVPDEFEQQVLALVSVLHGEGRSLREIGGMLTLLGVRPRQSQRPTTRTTERPRSGRWHPSSVAVLVGRARAAR